MSVSKWAYEPEICDGELCVGDCDLCDRWKNAERKVGIWGADSRCSVCGCEALSLPTETGDVWLLTDFCPFCGADLRRTPHERA